MLRREPTVVRSGISTAGSYELDVVAIDEFEGHVASSSRPILIRRFGLDGQSGRLNVGLRVVDDRLWPFGPDEAFAPLPVVAVDLLEAGDGRSRRASAALVMRR